MSRVRPVLVGASWADVALVAVVTAVGQQEVWAPAHGFAHAVNPREGMAAAYLVASLALLGRRRWPMPVLATVNAVLGLLSVTAGAPDGMGDLLPPLVAFYSAGRHAHRRQLPAATAITAGQVVLHERFDPAYVFDGRAVTVWLVVLLAGVVGYVLRRRSDLLDAARRDAQESEATRGAHARAAARAERTRIARELHDLVGHGMSLSVLQVVALQSTLDSGDLAATRRRLEQLERTTRDTLEEVRRLLAVTSEGVDEAPLQPQPSLRDLGQLVSDVCGAGGQVELAVSVDGEVPAGIGLAAYRIVQEALTNVIRHARAAARVVVQERDNGLLVEVVDEGSSAPGRFVGGRGVVGMQERVALYGGTFDIGRRPEGGVRVAAWLPLQSSST